MVNMLTGHIGHINSQKELLSLRHAIDKRIEHLCESIGCQKCQHECETRKESPPQPRRQG